MLLKKQGFPQDEELVLCTVTNIQYHSVFVQLDEYGRTGLIHISEISPGRIRNIRDYVTEGKKVVCKVLQVNQEKGHIDLSLRRVNEAQKREKLNDVKKEQLAEKIIEQVAKARGDSVPGLYQKISEKILQKFPTVFDAFERAATANLDLSEFVDKKIAKDITDLIKARIKPPEVKIAGDIFLTSYADDGVLLIKEALTKAEEHGMAIRYKGAGCYRWEITAKDYKIAEKILKKTTDLITTFSEKNEVSANIVRQEA
ncbi:translation initiation factor IF-2 subunit alpha [Candidatus Woesearchaeota archaeon]|nr:translation initiation factor IF-2 subunit alpha [Candidatus Woesearchaeota archaeon]